MKGKYLLGGLLMALLGATIALFAYTKIVDKPAQIAAVDSSRIETPEAKALLTSFQMQPGQVDFTFAAEQTVHAVVHVTTKTTVETPYNPFMEWFYGDRYKGGSREVPGYGSGVIISSDGYIITNNHVVEDAGNIEVTLNDNRKFKADVVGRDPNTDLALLKIKAENLSFLKYGDSEDLKVGAWVLAVGNPFLLGTTVTAGIVSAKGRDLNLLDTEYRIESYLQTDAALNPGNSGGALVDNKGLLVGITSAIYTPNGAYAGYSFAIPVSIVGKVVADLREFGEVQRALIGVNIRDVSEDDAKKQNLADIRGAVITDVRDGGSAADANLKVDDIIVKVNGVSVNSGSELQAQVSKHRPGDKVNLTYYRNGKLSTVPVILKNVAGNTSIVKPGMGAGNIFGARLELLSSADKRSYGVASGVKIAEINDGLFKDLGLKKGTVIVGINGKGINSVEDIRKATGSNEKSLKSMEIVTPDGRNFKIQMD